MPSPRCDRCDRELEDWVANVMVNDDYGRVHEVREVQVICKPCTIKMDERGEGNRWHNLWELEWLKDRKDLYYFAIDSIFDDILSYHEREKVLGVFTWSRRALGKVLRLVALSLDVEIDEERQRTVWEK